MTERTILEVRNLSKTYRVRRSIGLVETIEAAQRVSFAVERGRTLGIVGESGSGKSTVARCLLGLTPLTEGEVLLEGTQLGDLGVRKMRSHRRMMQMVFQMPQASFDPTHTVRSSVAQPLRRLRPDMSKSEQEERLRHVLTAVSLGEELWDRKPRALSGGQLQRAAIARALAPDPELVVLDEPTSSLDLSVRVASLLVYAMPTFWVGLMAVLVLAVGLGLAPAGGMTSAAAFELGPAAAALDVLAHLWLPALVLGLSMAGDIARYTRSSLIEFQATEAGRAARARGLSETRILLVHGLAHAAPRLLQLASVSAPLLLSGAVVAEVVFAWPGLGTATLLAIQSGDIPVVLAATAYGAVLVIAASLAADLLLARLDPRIRVE